MIFARPKLRPICRPTFQHQVNLFPNNQGAITPFSIPIHNLFLCSSQSFPLHPFHSLLP